MKLPFAIAVSLLAGCQTVGPDYVAPEVALPAGHRAETMLQDPKPPGPDEASLDLDAWWAGFEDPVLDELVQRSLVQNHDLRAALGSIQEWRARLGVTDAAAGPRAEANAQYQRAGISENTDFGLFPGQNRETNEYSLGLGFSWEIDLWGRLARSVEAAEADLASSEYGFWAVQVSLTGQLADAYLLLREQQNRLAIAQANVAVLEQSVGTARARFEAGLVQELDLLRARTDLESARATLPELQRAIWNTTSEIAMLVGEQPGELDELLAARPNNRQPNADRNAATAPLDELASPIPTPAARLNVPIPADLVRRRPNIRQAERSLAAQTARVGIAAAELYPRLDLTGSLGFLSVDLDNLFDEPSMTHALTPALRLPLFSGGGLRQNVAVQEAAVQQALVAYEATLLRALHEVDQSAAGIRFESQRLASLERAASEAATSLDRSRTLYEEGLSDIDAVLDARRNLFSLQDQAAQARAAHSRAYVSLYRSLGGGWPTP